MPISDDKQRGTNEDGNPKTVGNYLIALEESGYLL